MQATKRWICIVYLSFFWCVEAGFQHELSICALFQNDAKWLPEWIDFHQKQGVSHFWLYNNFSQDEYLSYLSPYIQSGVVELISWPIDYQSESEWALLQEGAYRDCIQRGRKVTRWCAFLDTDEFLFSPTGKTVQKVLQEFVDFPGVCVHWRMYGTSHVAKIPQGSGVLNTLLYRAPDDFGPHRLFKSVVQPRKVAGTLGAHMFSYRRGTAVDDQKKPHPGLAVQDIGGSVLRINHYWTRDEEFLYNVKIPRRLRWREDVETILRAASEMHAVYDPVLQELSAM